MVASEGGGTPRQPPSRREEEEEAHTPGTSRTATGRDSTGVPEKHGFDLFFGYYDQVHAHSFYPPYLIRNSEEVKLPGNEGGRTGQTLSLIHI